MKSTIALYTSCAQYKQRSFPQIRRNLGVGVTRPYSAHNSGVSPPIPVFLFSITPTDTSVGARMGLCVSDVYVDSARGLLMMMILRLCNCCPEPFRANVQAWFTVDACDVLGQLSRHCVRACHGSPHWIHTVPCCVCPCSGHVRRWSWIHTAQTGKAFVSHVRANGRRVVTWITTRFDQNKDPCAWPSVLPCLSAMTCIQGHNASREKCARDNAAPIDVL